MAFPLLWYLEGQIWEFRRKPLSAPLSLKSPVSQSPCFSLPEHFLPTFLQTFPTYKAPEFVENVSVSRNHMGDVLFFVF